MVQKTVMLSGSHLLVRMAGFALRIWLSRELGAQAMGLVELAQSAQMLLITPVVTGLPAAVARMCAQAEPPRQVRIVRCAAAMALLVGLPLAAGALLLRMPLAQWLGDVRTLPALLCYLPCIPVLGLSCALNGYFYGRGRPLPPALSELFEQGVRLLLCLRLIPLLRGWPMPMRAAVPSIAALAGETAGLVLMLLFCARTILFARGVGSRRAIVRELLSLAVPLTGMRLVSTLMRTVNHVLLPARLVHAGLSNAQALAEMGMLHGMLLPVLMMPSFITGSLCMVCTPELAQRQAKRRPMRSLTRRALLAALGVGFCAALGVRLLSPLIAHTLYRQDALLPLLRIGCWLIPVFALTQLSGGLMNALGLQGHSLRIALANGLVSVLLTFALAGMPALRLWGAVIAVASAQMLTLALNLRVLRRAIAQ